MCADQGRVIVCPGRVIVRPGCVTVRTVIEFWRNYFRSMYLGTSCKYASTMLAVKPRLYLSEIFTKSENTVLAWTSPFNVGPCVISNLFPSRAQANIEAAPTKQLQAIFFESGSRLMQSSAQRITITHLVYNFLYLCTVCL